MKKIEITDLIISGNFSSGIGVGLTKHAIEQHLTKPFGDVQIKTPDLVLKSSLRVPLKLPNIGRTLGKFTAVSNVQADVEYLPP